MFNGLGNIFKVDDIVFLTNASRLIGLSLKVLLLVIMTVYVAFTTNLLNEDNSFGGITDVYSLAGRRLYAFGTYTVVIQSVNAYWGEVPWNISYTSDLIDYIYTKKLTYVAYDDPIVEFVAYTQCNFYPALKNFNKYDLAFMMHSNVDSADEELINHGLVMAFSNKTQQEWIDEYFASNTAQSCESKAEFGVGYLRIQDVVGLWYTWLVAFGISIAIWSFQHLWQFIRKKRGLYSFVGIRAEADAKLQGKMTALMGTQCAGSISVVHSERKTLQLYYHSILEKMKLHRTTCMKIQRILDHDQEMDSLVPQSPSRIPTLILVDHMKKNKKGFLQSVKSKFGSFSLGQSFSFLHRGSGSSTPRGSGADTPNRRGSDATPNRRGSDATPNLKISVFSPQDKDSVSPTPTRKWSAFSPQHKDSGAVSPGKQKESSFSDFSARGEANSVSNNDMVRSHTPGAVLRPRPLSTFAAGLSPINTKREPSRGPQLRRQDSSPTRRFTLITSLLKDTHPGKIRQFFRQKAKRIRARLFGGEENNDDRMTRQMRQFNQEIMKIYNVKSSVIDKQILDSALDKIIRAEYEAKERFKRHYFSEEDLDFLLNKQKDLQPRPQYPSMLNRTTRTSRRGYMKSTLTFDRPVIDRSTIERSAIDRSVLQDSNVLEQGASNSLRREDAYKLHDMSQEPLLIPTSSGPVRNIVDHVLVSQGSKLANASRSKVYPHA